jgi:glycosyltransferase involved in cell wall biosynthesis
MNDGIKVAWLPAALDACALYRMFIPSLNVNNSRFLFRLGPLDLKELDGCNVAVVQRQVSEHNLNAIRRMKQIGLKVVYDLDDNIWALPAANPGKQVFDEMQDGFYKCAREADILTVSTKGLASAAKTGFGLTKEIIVVPNSIDVNLFEAKPLIRDDGMVLVGWGGSNTHSEDCKEAFDIMPEILDMNPHMRIEIVGAAAQDMVEKTESIVGDNGQRLYRKSKYLVTNKIALHPRSSYRNWVPVGEYANRLASWGWDIALAPLAENRFNRSKSCIKMLEAAALKIPCLASDVQPYNEFASLGGPDVKWLLCNKQRDWKDKLHELVNDADRRKELGQKMYDVAFKYFNAETIASNWSYVFNKVLAQ